MDLSSNVCSLCCSIESKRLLQPLVRNDDTCQEEFVREFLGPCQDLCIGFSNQSGRLKLVTQTMRDDNEKCKLWFGHVSGALACGRCREMIRTCQEFRTSCRRNLEKVRMIQEEGRRCQVPDSTSVIVKIERDAVELPDNYGLPNTPDSRRSSAGKLPDNSGLPNTPDSRRSSAGKLPDNSGLPNTPDSRRSSAGTIDSEGKRGDLSMDEEESVGEKTNQDERQSIDIENIKSEDDRNDDNRAKKREKAVQWRKSLYQVNSPSEAIRLNNYREANRMRNVRYRERKRTESTGSGEAWRGENNDEKLWRIGENNDDNKYWRGNENNDDNKLWRGNENNDNKLWRGGENEDNTQWRERKRTLSGDNGEFWDSERDRKASDGSIESWQSARNRTDSNGSIESWRADDDNTAPVNINVTPDVSLVVEEGYRSYQDEEEHTSNLSSTHIKPSTVLQRISSHPSKVIVPTYSSNLILPTPFPSSATPMPIVLREVGGGGASSDVIYLTPLSTPQSPIQAMPTTGHATLTLDPEERRRARNREASRRYREKARGDPGLLLKMREQQNKRQKKYYARLREKKYDVSGSYESKDTSFPFPPQMDWSPKDGGVAITPVEKGDTMEQDGMALDHHKPSISIIKHEYNPVENTNKQ